jgi:hypothetical protein
MKEVYQLKTGGWVYLTVYLTSFWKGVSQYTIDVFRISYNRNSALGWERIHGFCIVFMNFELYMKFELPTKKTLNPTQKEGE